jgi:hypothetical protein
MPIESDAADTQLLSQVIEYYHETLLGSPEALDYLNRRGIGSDEAIKTFKLGFANRTLGYRLPEKNRAQGAAVRGQLQRLGVVRESGHEHFNGSVVIPIIASSGEITEVYGRKITEGLRPGTPNHLYLPGPHRGVWNESALPEHTEIILCEALIDALTFWCSGYRNVTASYGIEGFTADHLAAFKRHGTQRVLIAYDRDEAGDRAAEKLAKELTAVGLDAYRIQFPKGMDANEYALKVTPAAKSLGLVIRKAQWLGKGEAPTIRPSPTVAASVPVASEEAAKGEIPTPTAVAPVAAVASITKPAVADTVPAPIPALPASPLPPPAAAEIEAQVRDEEIVILLGDRRYRIRGLAKNLAFDVLLKVNVLVGRGDAFHVDTLDLYSVRARNTFIAQAAAEIQVKEDVIRHDLGLVLRKLEEHQEEQIAKTLQPAEKPAMPAADHAEAMALLKDPHLLDRLPPVPM